MGHNTCKSMGRVLCVVRRYRSQVASILKTKMAAKMWMYQPASIKIHVERYLNYLCAKIHTFIQKCTPNCLRAPTKMTQIVLLISKMK